MACTMPTIAFEKEAPAMRLASASDVRASAFFPSAHAVNRLSAMSVMAERASESLTGFFWMEVYASTACVSASMPVVAVSLGGSDWVSTGSRIATCGTSL